MAAHQVDVGPAREGWRQEVTERVRYALEERLGGANGSRGYVKAVNVKLDSGNLSPQLLIVALKGGEQRRKKHDMVEQRFRITKMTSFEELKRCACDFWGLDPELYHFYDENFNDLMSLGGAGGRDGDRDHDNGLMRVENYFKIVLAKNNPTLMLAKAKRTQT